MINWDEVKHGDMFYDGFGKLIFIGMVVDPKDRYSVIVQDENGDAVRYDPEELKPIVKKVTDSDIRQALLALSYYNKKSAVLAPSTVLLVTSILERLLEERG